MRRLLEKIENIWYHYQSFIIAGLIIAVIGVTMIPSFSQSKETALRVVFIGNYVGDEQKISLLESSNSDVLGKNHTDSEIKMEFWNMNGLQFNLDQTNQKKLVAMIATENVDVIIMDKQSFTHFADKGTFLDLNEYVEKFPSESQFFTSGSHYYGIEVDQANILTSSTFNPENKVMGIVANSKHHDLAIKLAQWVVQ